MSWEQIFENPISWQARAERFLARLGANVDDYQRGQISYEEFNRRAIEIWARIDRAGLRERVLKIWRQEHPAK